MDGAKTNLSQHIGLTAIKSYDSDSDAISISRDSITNTHTMTMTNTAAFVTISTGDAVGGNPKHWEWEQVQKWLTQKGLSTMIVVFAEGATDKEGTQGVELLSVTLNKLFDDAGAYKAGEKLKIPSIEEAENSPIIDKFFRELTKLQLVANESTSSDFTEKDTTINDVVEMKRRIQIFIEKWDRILWIENYVDTNAKLPTTFIISEELGVSVTIAEVYLHYHENVERVQKKDVDELLLDFNVYNDCVIWWFVIVSVLTSMQTKAIWLLFNKVAELTPGNVAIELLDRYKFDLTRFDADKLDELAQNIVIGSQYPICASLRMSKWFLDIAAYDVARGHVFEGVSDSFIDAAFDYLDLLESDHMATVILEVKSDIEGMSAMDMALDFELTKFVTGQRIERITTSVMNDFEFLRPRNRDEAFQIDPLSSALIWRKLFYPQFYFTPLGTYCVEVFLYFAYLGLFTYLSVQQFRVYDEMSNQEIVFWLFNAGYVTNELQSLISEGLKQYFSDPQNYFDTLISIVFVASIYFRLYALLTGPDCGEEVDENGAPCWSTSNLNTIFVILWGIATITLWLRIVNFCILSHSLGPMVTMIFRMMSDIATFFEIMIILFLAFALCLMFILGDVMSDFATPTLACITLFRALLGDFEFENLSDIGSEVSAGILFFGYGIMLLYLVIGSLVLLNLLIAMMAKTFDTIEEDTTASIIFARFKLAIDRDTTPSYMAPPLNVFVMGFMILFYVIELPVTTLQRMCDCCRRKKAVRFDLAVKLMPKFMKERKLELDAQVLFDNCHKLWTITTNKGPTKCKIIKYKKEVGDHYVRFYNDNSKGIKVSVQNSVDKKHQWQVDLFDLHDEGLIEFSQFDAVFVDAEWTSKAHDAVSAHDSDDDQRPPYWICGFCRGYVKASKLSIKRLGYMLNVSDMEMKIVNKVSPDICPNCYRVRLERKRWELVWEIISYWLYKIMVAPLLLLIFGIVIGFGLIGNPSDLARAIDILKSKIMSAPEEAGDLVEEAVERVVDRVFSDEEHQREHADEHKKKLMERHKGDVKYVRYHYADTQLITNMNEMDEQQTIFDVAVRDSIWALLGDAKNDIDVFLMGEKINNHIMSLSSEDELTEFEFFDDFINMGGLKKNGGDFLWTEYFSPLALTIFERIQKLRNICIPLHLFRRYPFDIHLVLDDFTAHFDHKENFNKQFKDLDGGDIVDALNHLECLNCINEEQRKTILAAVASTKDDVWHQSAEDTTFDKFVRYMSEVQALFQDTRTIKNMLRDVGTGIIERGADSSLFQDQIHFLFEDIRNVTLATPFFNSMRTDIKKGESKLELWTIRNTLFSLYFLNNTVRENILKQHSRLYVEKQQLLNMVYKEFVHDVIDPEGITNLIYTEDHEEEEEEEKEVGMGHFHSVSRSRSFLFAQKSTIGIGKQLEEHDEADLLDEETRHQIILERMELFNKGAITATAVRDEISSIFDKIQQHRKNKITESTIDYYRRKGLKSVRLLQDDETLRFIFEQLSRYATFYPSRMKDKCSVDLLKTIFYNTLEFGEDYVVDHETIPKEVHNDRYIQQLYDHLYDLYNDTIKNKFNSIIIEQTLEYMTLEDVLSMIMLYERTFSTLNTKIVDAGDAFVATHDVFCKFVDGKGFDPDMDKNKWTNKTLAASDLYQACLDEAQAFVTLGQIRQTINKLMNDIAAMKCGELTRIMNHLHKQYKNDNVRCKEDRVKYVDFLAKLAADAEDDDVEINELETQLSFLEDGDDNPAKIGRSATMKNPGLSFKHISKTRWTRFMADLSAGFQMNVLSTKISNILQDDEHKQMEEEKYDENKGGGKKIIDSILDNTAFDIIKVHVMAEEEKNEEKEEEKNGVDKSKKRRRTSVVNKKRGEVFDTILSFCAGRITLQQLFQFSKAFKTFLSKNGVVDSMMKKYHKIINSASVNNFTQEIQMKKKKIAKKYSSFKKRYFDDEENVELNVEQWSAEINYLFIGCENKYDLCHKIYPFWSGSIIQDIYSFMESTEQIQGNYELKEAEFGQLKHSLNVNGELAIKLFHIIRFKIRTLSWKQIYNYFKFLLKMKYNVQKATLTSQQAGDETVSLDGIKMVLKIQLNDESKWLFSKVDSFHGAKVTWKQIRKYLQKMITVRDEMRDFFRDNKRDRDFEDDKAEIINTISETVESTQEQNESLEEKLLTELHSISKRLTNLENKMDSMNMPAASVAVGGTSHLGLNRQISLVSDKDEFE